MHAYVGSMKHNACKLWKHILRHTSSTYKHMNDGTLACSLQQCAHRATQTCQSPLRAFQAASISSDLKDLWIWKSADNTSSHITTKPVTARCWRGGTGWGGVFLPSWAWISTVAGGRGCQPIRRCCYHWLSGSRPWILSAARQPFSPKCPPDNEGEKKKKENQDVYWSDWSESEKHKFYGLNKSNPIWPGWHFTGRHRKGQTEIGGCYQTHRGNFTEAVQGDSTFEFQWTQTHTHRRTHSFRFVDLCRAGKRRRTYMPGPQRHHNGPTPAYKVAWCKYI